MSEMLRCGDCALFERGGTAALYNWWGDCEVSPDPLSVHGSDEACKKFKPKGEPELLAEKVYEWDIGDFKMHETGDVQELPVEDACINIFDSAPVRLGGYKAVYIYRFPWLAFKPKGWRQWVVFLWGTDVWFGRWPFCKCLFAANVLVWMLGWVMG